MICANKMHALPNNAAPSEVICSLKDFSPKYIKSYSEEPQIFVQVFKRSHSKLSLLMYINQFFIFINLCMCLCGWMWDVPAASHMWKSEDNLGCYRSLLSTLFETGSLLFTVAYVNICKICCRPKTFWGYYCLYFPSPYSNSEITEAGYHTQLSMSSGNLNSDLPAWVGSVFPTEVTPWSLRFQVRMKHKNKNCSGYELTTANSKSLF